MNETNNKLSGPDFVKGVSLSKVADGAMVLGHAHGEPVSRRAATEITSVSEV